MQLVHVRSLEKFHPGYKDRTLQWAKIHCSMVQGDPEMEMINEVDWSRLIKFILLELEAKKPIPLDEKYLRNKGFNLKNRPIALTLNVLHNFLEVVTEDLKPCGLEKSRVEERKSRVDTCGPAPVSEFNTFLVGWNEFAVNNGLSSVKELTDSRIHKIKLRLMSPSFNLADILASVKEQPFLLGENKSGWKVSFDWIVENDSNFLKVLEKKYVSTAPDDGLTPRVREFIKMTGGKIYASSAK